MRPPDARVSDFVTALGGKRAAIGVAILIAALSFGALILIQKGDGAKPVKAHAADNPFYIEASIVVLGAPSGNNARPEQSTSSLQWWYQRPGVWHWQLDTQPTGGGDPITVLSVADGKFAYLYNSDSNSYTRVPVSKYVAAGLPVDFILGPVDINQLTANWEATNTTVSNGGNSQYMGRDAHVLQYSPTWHSSGAGGDKRGGIGRIWIDDDSGLVMRNLVDGGPTSDYTDARVTMLNLEPKFDSAVFSFDAPEGAELVK